MRLDAEDPPDVRFMSRYFLEYGREQLRHGVELVAAAFEVGVKSIAKELAGREAEQRFYTIDILDEVLDHVADSPENHLALRHALARMLTFDALVGAVDRHAENWGIVEDVRRVRSPRFAPVYDTASGLFVRRSEDDLPSDAADCIHLIESYAKKSKPLIGTGEHGACNHFELVEFMLGKRDNRYRLPIRQVIDGFRPIQISSLIRGFRRYFSRRRTQLIDGLVRYRYRVLREILDGTPWETACRSAKSARNLLRS